MEEDNEVLDWGQEDDEENRRASYDQNTGGDFDDPDDIEDTVSLGDEDDQGYYYQRQDANRGVYDKGIGQEAPERPPSPRTRGDDMGANDRRSPRRPEAADAPATQNSVRSMGSPTRRSNSRNHTSPRSNHNGGRLTHALPPKPVTYPYIPSHPLVVGAVGMATISPGRTTARDSKKLNGTPGKPEPSSASADLPQHWEERYSRHNGDPYFYNRETFESTRTHPVSSIPSTSSLGGSQSRRRRLSVSSGTIHVSPPDSNTHHSQTSRPNRDRSRTRLNDQEDVTRSLTPDLDGLSFHDRHYRPGGDTTAVSAEVRADERTAVLSGRLPAKSRYDRSPPNSPPPRSRRRARSASPAPDTRGSHAPPRDRGYQPPRGSGHPARERNVSYTNPDSVISRDINVPLPESGFAGRQWAGQGHPADMSKNDRSSRREPHRPMDDDASMLAQHSSDNRNRPSLRRRESSRGPRERESLRPSDRREKANEQQSFISAPRHRSPPRTREHDSERDPGSLQELESSNRRDRPRFDHTSISNSSASVARPARENVNTRTRDFDTPQYQANHSFEQPRRDRRNDRDYDRFNRHDPAHDNKDDLRRLDYTPVEPNRSSNDRPKHFQDDYDQLRTDESSNRRRVPLPPQNKTFLSSSTTSSNFRDQPPPTEFNKDIDNKWARRTPNGPRNEEPIRQHQDQGQSHKYPRIDTRMDIEYNGPSKSGVHVSPYQNARNLDLPPREYHEQSAGPRSARGPTPRSTPVNIMQTGLPSPTLHRGPDNARYEHSLSQPPPAPLAKFDDRKAPDNHEGSRHNQLDTRPGWRDSRSGNMFPERNTNVERDAPPPRQEYRGRPEEGAWPSPRGHVGPVSGTNNVPIGIRRPPGSVPVPPTNVNVSSSNIPNGVPGPGLAVPPSFNPDARPPPSTLIDPAKARDLPLGKDRPPNVTQNPRWAQSLPEPPLWSSQSSVPERTPQMPTPIPGVDNSKRRRESRFSPVEPLKARFDQPPPVDFHERQQEQDEIHTISIIRPKGFQSTPPMISRAPSNISLAVEQMSSRLSDHGHTSDARSDNSRNGPSRYPEQRPEHQPRPPRFSDNTVQLPPDPPLYQPDQSAPSHVHPDKPVPESSMSGQNRARTRWGDRPAVAPVQAEQSSDRVLTTEYDGAPSSLSRRLSTEKAPRSRKHPGAENNFRGAEKVNNVYPPVDLRGPPAQGDFKNRLEWPAGDPPASLLARLSTPTPDNRPPALHDQPQSLRDRIVPSKRDRDDMLMEDINQRDAPYDAEEGNDSKRKRRNAKSKRGGRKNVI